MNGWIRWLLGLCLGALALGGLMRLRVSTDVLDLIPNSTPGVTELKRLNSHLADERMLLVLIETTEEGGYVDEVAVEKLAARLREVDGTARVLSPTEGVDEAAGFAEVVGYLWLNGDSEAFRAQLAACEGSGPERALAAARRKLAGSFDEIAVARAGYDPLGFTQVPLLEWTEENLRSLAASDGAATLLRVEADRGLGGYKDYGVWIERVRGVIDGVKADGGEAWRVSLTGSPAFAAEIGGAMEKDMAGTTGAAGFLIVGLFLLLQRSLRQLVAIGLCIGATLALTLAAFGWAIGDLGVVSGGFAAILMGLTVDYAMIISREVQAAGGDRREGRNRARKGIVWGAVTTAAPFAVLMTSAMPGGQQLGFLVMSGLLIGAVVMLGVFPVMAFGRDGKGASPRTPRLPTCGAVRARWVGISLAVVGVGLAVWLGRDARLSFDLETLRPTDSPAMEGLRRAQARFPAWDEGSVHVLTQDDRLVDWSTLKSETRQLIEGGVLSSVYLPEGLLPDEGRFAANAKAFGDAGLSSAAPLKAGLEAAGFTESAGALAEEVLRVWARDSAGTAQEAFERAAQHPLLANQVLVEPGFPTAAVGAARLSVDLDDATHAKLSALSNTGVTFTSWLMLGPAIEPLLAADLTGTLLPMFLALTAALLIALRSWREAGLAVGLLLLGLTWVFVVMGLRAGTHEFLFLDVLGLVMLMGVGLDYTLHLTFALRREKGDAASVMRSTGTAIAFCAVSTAIGFGSLTLASNRALAGLGWLAGGGILLLALLILGLLPGLWLRRGGRRLK